MIYLNYSNLDTDTQNRLLQNSKRDIERKFGNDLKSYANSNGLDYDTLLEEEATRNLYNYKYSFKP
ncbi:MAG: hypothetical protein AB3N18_02820 [Allomuricauda sp.]